MGNRQRSILELIVLTPRPIIHGGQNRGSGCVPCEQNSIANPIINIICCFQALNTASFRKDISKSTKGIVKFHAVFMIFMFRFFLSSGD